MKYNRFLINSDKLVDIPYWWARNSNIILGTEQKNERNGLYNVFSCSLKNTKNT